MGAHILVFNPSVEHPFTTSFRHGGYGYQSSWGSASVAADLLVASLKGVFTIVG
jgi:hypothetical protein